VETNTEQPSHVQVLALWYDRCDMIKLWWNNVSWRMTMSGKTLEYKKHTQKKKMPLFYLHTPCCIEKQIFSHTWGITSLFQIVKQWRCMCFVLHWKIWIKNHYLTTFGSYPTPDSFFFKTTIQRHSLFNPNCFQLSFSSSLQIYAYS